MASVTIRNLSQETKDALAERARRHKRSLEDELRRILDEAARADAGNPDALEPLGSFIVRITRPGYDDFADIMERVVAERRRPDRPLPDFE